jgi:ankyrin repeat protein
LSIFMLAPELPSSNNSNNNNNSSSNNNNIVYQMNNSMDHNYEVSSEETSSADDDQQDQQQQQATDTILITLVHAYDWAGTLARIASHPQETCILSTQGRPPLHVACENDAPAVVIQSLLAAYPEASLLMAGCAGAETTCSTMNPLHITCSSRTASVHVVRVLLEGGHGRQCIMRDEDGDTPLHTACRCGAPMEVLEVLLRVCSTAVYERDYEGLTPVQRLWVRYFVILGKDAIERVRGPADLQGELEDAWNKTELLLSCAHRGSLLEKTVVQSVQSSLSAASLSNSTKDTVHGGVGGNSNSATSSIPTDHDCAGGVVFRAVHAAAAVDCPRAVLKIAAAVYPRQLGEKDENGMTPLMIAAQAPIFKVRDLSDEGYSLGDVIYGVSDDQSTTQSNSNNNNGVRNNNGSIRSSNHSQDGWLPDNNQNSEIGGSQPSVIEILLQANQEAASAAACVPDPVGRLPLHWALATGKKWDQGIKPLVEVYPEALTVLDVETKLYPFMLAAQAVGDMDLGTVYEVLRLDPAMFDGLSHMAAAAAVAVTAKAATATAAAR